MAALLLSSTVPVVGPGVACVLASLELFDAAVCSSYRARHSSGESKSGSSVGRASGFESSQHGLACCFQLKCSTSLRV